MTLPAANDQKHKDACQYSVDVAKEFLGLAAAGVAFVIGLIFAGDAPFTKRAVFWSLGSLAVSLLLGWLYLMNVVSSIAQYDNYNVYQPRRRFLAGFQIVAFLVAVGVLADATRSLIQRTRPRATIGDGAARFGGVTITGLDRPGAAVDIKVDSAGGVDLRLRR